jgi:hypothetical protein
MYRRVIGRARILPEHRRHSPALEPGRWYNQTPPPADVLTPPLEGYVWIDLDGQHRPSIA